MGKLSGVQRLKCARLIALFSVLGFIFLTTVIHAEDEIPVADKDFLISLCKKIEIRNKIENNIGPWYDLDNMDVEIYRKNNYIVVHFSLKQTPGNIIKGGDIAYYFVKKESGDYQFIKALLGQ